MVRRLSKIRAKRAGNLLGEPSLRLVMKILELICDFAVLLHRLESYLAKMRAQNEAGERVVVLLGNRIKLVVVTSRTRDR